jgi:glucose 1-dehydrogenase
MTGQWVLNTAATPIAAQPHVAVVTGGASGIGLATARRLAQDGAAVVVADISADGAQACAEMRRAGHKALFVRADVSEAVGWLEVMSAADTLGPVSVLVSNAFTVDVSPLHDMSEQSWQRQVAVCLTGAFLGVRATIGDLKATRGSVVFISSVHANFGLPGHGAYAAAKGALVSLARQLAVEYGPEVRVNTVLPGPILTAAWDRVPEVDRARSVEQTAAGRFGTPEEVAAAVAFLASREAAFITGADLVVDGGWSVVKSSA